MNDKRYHAREWLAPQGGESIEAGVSYFTREDLKDGKRDYASVNGELTLRDEQSGVTIQVFTIPHNPTDMEWRLETERKIATLERVVTEWAAAMRAALADADEANTDSVDR